VLQAARGTAALALLLAGAARGDEARPLFQLARNKNANVVEYAARVAADGLLDEGQPLDAYWILRASDGRREGLSWLEQIFAYGFSAKVVRPREVYSLTLVAFRERALEVRRRAGSFEAMTVVGGVPSRLVRVFVTADERSGTPKVQSVELYGQSLSTGGPTYEQLTPR
jgi:hypothetical protein